MSPAAFRSDDRPVPDDARRVDDAPSGLSDPVRWEFAPRPAIRFDQHRRRHPGTVDGAITENGRIAYLRFRYDRYPHRLPEFVYSLTIQADLAREGVTR